MIGANNFAAPPITPITAPKNENTALFSSTKSFRFLNTVVMPVMTGVNVSLKIGTRKSPIKPQSALIAGSKVTLSKLA